MKTIERGKYKCFICGGEIEYEEEDNEAVCDFCGRKYEIIDAEEDTKTPVVEIYTCPGSQTCNITKCYHYRSHTHVTGCENECFGNSCVLQMSEPEVKTIKINDRTDFDIRDNNDFDIYQRNFRMPNDLVQLNRRDLLNLYLAIGEVINGQR